ncbi:hypothetical protein R1flu_006204 [Riccia fluitans]|uniref:Uncharacterized protein n=1 Tax=Riccia fluitans TaxID=41844 RepID=A0ABD1YVN2_9MARC
MEEAESGVDVEEALRKVSCEEPLPVKSIQEDGFTPLSKLSDPETEVLAVGTNSAANAGDFKVASPCSDQSCLAIAGKTDISSVSKASMSQSLLHAKIENLPEVGLPHPSLMETDASTVVPSSADSSSRALLLREPESSAMKVDSPAPVDTVSQSFRSETSGASGTTVGGQNMESGDKMDVEPTDALPGESASEDNPTKMEAEGVMAASNDPVHSEEQKLDAKLSEPVVSITPDGFPPDSPGKENAPEKTAKRGAEEESTAEKPAKKNKKNDVLFSVPDAVEAVLGSTAEIVVVLAGMAEMRAGRPFTSLEKDLAAVAYQNVSTLVSKVAPNVLVSKQALDTMIRDLNLKKMAQTRKEKQARAKALAEAEAKAKAKMAEAEAKLKAEEIARMKAKAEADAEERKQAALIAAAAVATSPVKDAKPVAALTPSATPPGQPAQALSPPVEPKISSASLTAPSSIQGHTSAQDISQLEATPEKTARESSPSQQSSITPLGRPPKVRGRSKKDSIAPTLLSPDYLEYIQSSVPETQRPQVTHKQLCIAVQQFIQEQMPHASQIPEAIPPSYISASTPCQICRMVAKETTTVIVCDSCDKLFHVKCVQPNSHTKGVRKGDWNCPQCLSGGRSYREKYGSYQPGSNNGVKLWAPHDTSEDNNVLISGSGAGSSDGRNGSVSSLTQRGNLTVDVERGSNTIKDERNMGKFGGSPHLIVQLVNEPSPRTEQPPQNSSVTHAGGHMSENLASGSQLKVTGRTDAGDSRTVTEPSGNARLSRRDSEVAAIGDTRATGPQVGSSQRAAEQRTESNATNLPGKHAEVPLQMDWVGDSSGTVEGKTYYKSCRVGGHTYHLGDCALFRPETPDVPPYIARLQALWEDLSTSHKWVRVSWCYYPNDIPVTMGRPGRVEPDEVYESNHCDSNLVFVKTFHLCSSRGGYTTLRKGCSNRLPNKFVSESTSSSNREVWDSARATPTEVSAYAVKRFNVRRSCVKCAGESTSASCPKAEYLIYKLRESLLCNG